MHIIPAIDLFNGKVVRLFQGDYTSLTHYSDSPIAVAQSFANQGYKRLHVIDLAGAKTGTPQAFDQVSAIVSTGIDVQVGGGIRTLRDAQQYFDIGVKQIIIGTKALSDPSFIDTILKTHSSDAIIVSLDVRDRKLAIEGWTKEHPSDGLTRHLKQLKKQGIKHVIVTDITRDGTLRGINFSLYHPLKMAFQHMHIYAAGGVSSVGDIEQLQQLGISGAIVGRAFYEAKSC